MDEDAGWLPLSAVERYAFCPRQAYLFHAEGQKVENRFTVEGRLLHRRATEGEDESRPGVEVRRALLLRSERLRVRGVADVVEFRNGIAMPVEYKRGGAKSRACEHHQLCLQALCLEEMLRVSILEGAVFHGATRRRERVAFTPALRASTEALVGVVRSALERPQAPPSVAQRGCQSCSLVAVCLPHATGGSRSARQWTARRLGL